MKILTDSRSCIPCEWCNDLWPVPSLFPPRQIKVLHNAILSEILHERVVSSTLRVRAMTAAVQLIQALGGGWDAAQLSSMPSAPSAQITAQP